MVVCKNLWIDGLRRAKFTSNESMELWPISQDNPEHQYLTDERNRLLYESILGLPERYREILVLHYFADLPLTNIGEVMQLTPSNVKTIAFRARVKLKQKLEEYDYEF